MKSLVLMGLLVCTPFQVKNYGIMWPVCFTVEKDKLEDVPQTLLQKLLDKAVGIAQVNF